MKTYTRRKPVHKLIENVHEFCRLCLQNTRDLSTIALFTNENDIFNPPLTTKIMICLGLELSNEEGLPNIICAECFEKVDNFYTFRKKCGVAYQAFKSHSLASKETSANSTTETVPKNDNEEVPIASDLQEDKILLTFLEDKQLGVISSQGDTDTNAKENENGEQQDHTLPEISNFLKSVLLELGIIRKNGDDLLWSDFLGSTIEMETGDGWQMTLQLSEIIGNEETSIETNEQTQKSREMRCDSTQDLVSSVEDEKEWKNGRVMCRVCGKEFVSRGVLRRHGRTHSGERPYACRACPRRFAQREVLRRHELVHLERRPFACDLCPKSFTQRGALTTHRRSHAPPAARSFELHRCLVCPKFFLHASGLSRHMRTHSMQPPVSCGVCARTFRDREALQRHARSAHNAKPAKHKHDTQTIPATEPCGT